MKNPGFEQWQDSKPEGWEIGEKSWKNGAKSSLDAAHFHRGQQSLLLEQIRPITLPAESRDAPNLLGFIKEKKAAGEVTVTQNIPVEPGKRYNLKFWYKTENLLRENRNDPKQSYAAFFVFVFWMKEPGVPIGGKEGTLWVLNEQENVPDWTESVNQRAHSAGGQPMIAPEGARYANVRFSLVTMAPDIVPKAWVDDVVVEDADAVVTSGNNGETAAEQRQVKLVNPGFEAGNGDAPTGWKPVGTARVQWVNNPVHSGKRAVEVSDAGMGDFSGWATDIPIKEGRAYKFSGWVKCGDLALYGPVGGGAVAMQFLGKDGQMLGTQTLSEAVPSNSDWKKVETRETTPPDGAVTLRLIVGLHFCKGSAWFDDVSLTESDEAVTKASIVRRLNPEPAEGVVFAKNLLANGDIEAGVGGKPANWTYVGKSDKDWTPEEIATLHRETRVRFSIGRGRGEWSHDVVYSGKGALLNVSIDPPISKNQQFYRRDPVDGFWLSDPMPCQPGHAYLTGGWVRMGAPLLDTLNEAYWFGPLEIRFYDQAGKQVPVKNEVRSFNEQRLAGKWLRWATMPWVAPESAVTMRLRFGQELRASHGGWGKTYADNLAVWELPSDASIPKVKEIFEGAAFWHWFRHAHENVKPPYLPSPAEAPEYGTCYGELVNTVPGSLYSETSSVIPLTVRLNSFIGETRKVSLSVIRYDWLGNAEPPIETAPMELKGSSDAMAILEMPPTNRFGTFYLEGKVKEGDAVVGEFTGRYAVMPPLQRPRTAENIWAVTTLATFFGGDHPYDKEVGSLLKTAGFGLSWLNLTEYGSPHFEKTQREVAWYLSLGIRPILRINNFEISRPIDLAYYEELGKRIATEFKGKVAAYGNWGVEQAVHRTEKTPVWRPIINGKFLSDEEYDMILSSIYDGIKSVDKETPTLIGNMPGDTESADAVRRLYGKPAEGRFDGAILNAYGSMTGIVTNSFRVFDEHGDKQKTAWIEENAEQSAPLRGPARRYSEGEGAKRMVRAWLTLKATHSPRLKAVTMWGFIKDDNITMITPSLQPRPHFLAHAVMADATADAVFVANRSLPGVTFYEWKRGDGPMYVIFAGTGERSLTLETSAKEVTVMDMMGNRQTLQPINGLVNLKVGTSPLYLSGGAVQVSQRLGLQLDHGDTNGKPAVKLTLKNNDRSAISGTVRFIGPVEGKDEQPFSLQAGESTTILRAVTAKLDETTRTSFGAECTTAGGDLYTTSASLNFMQIVKTPTPPTLHGTWKGWEAARPVSFGLLKSQITVPGNNLEAKYTGPEDISGKLRMLWDKEFLYLGVEATDNSFRPQTERGMKGFMGDSIEFAFQPDNRLSREAPIWEFELYLPDGHPPYAASRRLPAPPEMITHWKASVIPTGVAGNVNYQAAIPWKDIGMTVPVPGKTISFALILSDVDAGELLTGWRCRVHWFDGLDITKNPEGFGDVTLVE
ncbi:MAG: carbohydrate binding domain-containing protein [Verrucomicrobiota bacterium]